MNRRRRVYISDTPRILSYESVRHSLIDVADGYAFSRDSIAFSSLHLDVMADYSGG